MVRVLFWILVAVSVAIFLAVVIAGPTHVSADVQVVICGFVGAVVTAATAGLCALTFGYCWKMEIAVLPGRYGSRRWARDSQPFGYWSVMSFYVVAFLAMLGVDVMWVLSLLPDVVKLLNH